MKEIVLFINTSVMADIKSGGNTQVLQQILWNKLELSTKLRQFHWNIVGPNFLTYHPLMTDIMGVTDSHIDTIAETIRQIGGIVDASKSASMSKIKIPEGKIFLEKEVIQAVYDDLCIMCSAINKAITHLCSDESNTAAVHNLKEILVEDNKYRWFLESLLK